MNTDTMIALAANKRSEYMHAAARERLAGKAASGRLHPSQMQRARLAIGAALISAGSRLQGVATSLPEPSALGQALSAGQAGR